MISLALLLTQIQIVMIPINGIIPGAYIKCGGLSNIGGLYNQETKVIYVCSNYTGKERLVVLVHEMGHYVWFEKLTESQRISYENEWEKGKDFYSEYSKVSVEEGFAEDFYFVHTKKHKRTTNTRLRLVKNILRNL